MRISAIPEAKAVIIEVEENGNLKHYGWQHVIVELPQGDNVDRASAIELKRKDVFLSSLARRAIPFLLWMVVANDHVGVFPKQVVYDGGEMGWDTPYRVVNTNPTGDVQITPKTKITIKLYRNPYLKY